MSAKREVVQEGSAAIVRIDPEALIRTAVEKGSSVETLERLFQLYKDVQAQSAKLAWFEAVARFQAECPAILKNRLAQTEKYSFTYATLDNILETVGPKMGECGLSIAWSLIRDMTDEKRVTYTCRISHEMGHTEESGPVTIPITYSTDGKGATPAQRVNIAHSYSKRISLLAILGMAPTDEEEEEGAEPKVPQPTRASEKKPQPAARTGEVQVWVGKIKQVNERSGKSSKGAWKLYVVVGEDGTDFGTFDADVADDARAWSEQGTVLQIEWALTEKGARKIVCIGPAEPGSGDEPDPGA